MTGSESGLALGIVVLFFAALAAYFYWLAHRATVRAARLANLSLCAAMLGFVGFQLLNTSRAVVVTSLLFGVTGVVFASRSSRARRTDGAGPRVRPIVGGVLAVLHLCVVLAQIRFAMFTSTSNPWKRESPDGRYHVSLPSDCWREVPVSGPRPVAKFVCSSPMMAADVLSVRTADSEEYLIQLAGKARDRMARMPGRKVTPYSGTNPSGTHYRYQTMIDNAAEAPEMGVYIAHCFAWKPSNGVLVEILFEAPLRMSSMAGQEAEAQAIVTAVERICKGVQ